MAWPKLLVLVRHAESEGNIRTVDERAEFDTSANFYDITPRGVRQAQITGKYLRDNFGEFDVYYRSYFTRTNRTLEVMYPDAHVYEDARLAEAQRGIWHAMTKDQIIARFPEEVVRKEREGLYHYRPWGGENWPDVELRAHSFLGTLGRDYADKKVLCVVHGQWLIVLQKLIHHFSIEEALEKYNSGIFENTSVTIYEGEEKDGKSRLVLKEENIVPWKGLIE